MSWLNIPVEIVESVHQQIERQFFVAVNQLTEERHRKITWTRSRWVGGNKAAAVAKAESYLDNGNAETEVVRAGEAGQYQCIITLRSYGNWSAWATYIQPPEDE